MWSLPLAASSGPFMRHYSLQSLRMTDISSLIATSVRLSEEAGHIIRGVMASGDLQRADKGENDPVTIADTRAQHLIEGSMRKWFPSVTFVGEEEIHASTKDAFPASPEELASSVCDEDRKAIHAIYGETVDSKRLCLYVDPLDATKEFVDGDKRAVMVLIGIVLDGKPIAGVLHQPFFRKWSEKEIANVMEKEPISQCYNVHLSPYVGRTIFGVVGMGIRGCDFLRNLVESNERKSNSDLGVFRLLSSSNHQSPIVERMERLVAPTSVLRMGGAGHKIVHVLEGTAEVYAHPVHGSNGPKKWDVAAPGALILAAGGSLTDFDGNDMDFSVPLEHQNEGKEAVEGSSDPRAHTYLSNGILVSCAVRHQELVSRLSGFFSGDGST